MSELYRKYSKRVFALLMAVILLVILFFAVSLLAEEFEHDCTGEHCPVCACIQVCESVVHQIGTGLISAVCIVLCFAAVCAAVSFFFAEFPAQNLITLKIRLNI